MEKQMMCISDIGNVLDQTIQAICKRVTGVSLTPCDNVCFQSDRLYSILVTTTGDYRLSLLLCGEQSLLETMVGGMKRGAPVAEGDIPIYIAELSNILCGHIVSSINRQFQQTARFGIPQVVGGLICQASENHIRDQGICYYTSQHGALYLKACFYSTEMIG